MIWTRSIALSVTVACLCIMPATSVPQGKAPPKRGAPDVAAEAHAYADALDRAGKLIKPGTNKGVTLQDLIDGISPGTISHELQSIPKELLGRIVLPSDWQRSQKLLSTPSNADNTAIRGRMARTKKALETAGDDVEKSSVLLVQSFLDEQADIDRLDKTGGTTVLFISNLLDSNNLDVPGAVMNYRMSLSERPTPVNPPGRSKTPAAYARLVGHEAWISLVYGSRTPVEQYVSLAVGPGSANDGKFQIWVARIDGNAVRFVAKEN